MATGQLGTVLEHLRRSTLRQDGGGMTDGQLLECFISERDEAAFEALVRRHGPMVLGVCRRVLGNEADAEDAFQATFLVLVRKASAIGQRELVGNWLHGVAHRAALEAKAARRRVRERQVSAMPEPEAAPEAEGWLDLRAVLDRELNRLPDKYRVAVVLCDLEGRTRREVAQQLGLPEGTLSGRLTTARRLLARRLARPGLTLSGAALALVLSQQAASACVPAALVGSTVKAAALLAVGKTAAGVLSAKVAALTEGVLKAMLLTKLKLTAAFLVVIGLVALGTGTLAHHALAGTTTDRPAAVVDNFARPALEPEPADQALAVQRPKAQPKDATTVSGALQAVDADKNSVTITISNRRDGQMEKTYPVARDARILRDGKEIKLTDLKKPARITLKLSPDQKTVVGISQSGPALTAQVKSVDAARNTVTVTIDNVRKGKFERTLTVAKDAKVTVNGKQARLTDLKEGTPLLFMLSAEDGNTVLQIQSPRRGRPDGEE